MSTIEVTIEAPNAHRLANELSELVREEFGTEPRVTARSLGTDGTHKDGTTIAIIALLITLPSAIADAPAAVKNIKAVVEWGKEKVSGSSDTFITLGLNDRTPVPVEDVESEELLKDEG